MGLREKEYVGWRGDKNGSKEGRYQQMSKVALNRRINV